MPNEATLAHPGLYAADDGGVHLLALRCTACGHIAFPRQDYGCERCGATAAQPATIAARGTLTSFATVHLHQSKAIAAPFVVGEVQVDEGPSLRITLVEPTDAGLRIGARVRGVLHAVPAAAGDAGAGAGTTPVMELRFTRENAP